MPRLPLRGRLALRVSPRRSQRRTHARCWWRSDSRLEVIRGEDAAGRSFGPSRGLATRSACAASSRGVAVAHAHARLRGSVTCV